MFWKTRTWCNLRIFGANFWGPYFDLCFSIRFLHLCITPLKVNISSGTHLFGSLCYFCSVNKPPIQRWWDRKFLRNGEEKCESICLYVAFLRQAVTSKKVATQRLWDLHHKLSMNDFPQNHFHPFLLSNISNSPLSSFEYFKLTPFFFRIF